MEHAFCPGSKLLRQPAPEMFACPSCGEEVEIWTDELKGTCAGCQKTIYRDAAMSCLDWCKYGKECVGDAVYETHLRNKAIGLKQQLLDSMRSYFDQDRKRIEHAERVLAYAEQLLETEGGDWHIVVPASILHDVGIKVAEDKYGSSAGSYQEREGPPVARKMLLRLGLRMEDIDQICDIVGHHHSPGTLESINFKVLYDADSLVNLREVAASKSPHQLRVLLEKTMLTRSGKALGLQEYLESAATPGLGR